MKRTVISFAIASITSGLSIQTAQAQTNTPVQAPSSAMTSPVEILAFPSTFGIPSAVPAPSGTAFIGATYATPRGGIKGANGDGDISAGYSFGNPFKGVSTTVGLNITGTTDPFADAGSLSLSLSRVANTAPSSLTFIGASASNLTPWGVNTQQSQQYNAYISHLTVIHSDNTEIPVQFSVGYGTDSTRSDSNPNKLLNGAYAGFGIGMTKYISGSISFNSTQVNAGISASIPNTSFGISLGVFDVTQKTDRQQVATTVSYSF